MMKRLRCIDIKGEMNRQIVIRRKIAVVVFDVFLFYLFFWLTHILLFETSDWWAFPTLILLLLGISFFGLCFTLAIFYEV